MSNKYLEKVALNAVKARAMAKQVGVIPDPTSNWKWALRNLRDDRGDALQGEALDSAKKRMGSMGTENFKKLQKAQAANPDKEIGYGVTPKGELKSVHVGRTQGITINTDKVFKSTGREGHVGHTHHMGPSIQKDLPQFYKDNPHRLTDMSGRGDHVDLGERHLKKTFNDVRYDERLRKVLLDDLEAGKVDPEVAGQVFNRYTKKTMALGGQGRDVRFAVLNNNYSNGIARIGKHSISTPEIGVEGLHRTVGYYNMKTKTPSLTKLRTVYLKHDTQ